LTWRDAVDRIVEFPVFTSYTSIGPAIRRRVDQWTPLSEYDLADRVVALTGPTSGIGRAAAFQLASIGANLLLLARDEARASLLRDELAAVNPAIGIDVVRVDLSDLSSVRAAATAIQGTHQRLDVLIHNAGTLSQEHSLSPDGLETTVATQVAGPFLLTALLLDRLHESAPSRVITMSSGGMYTQRLDTSALEMAPAEYRGATAYARAKRAQVTLNQIWAARMRDSGIRFHALHPGWVDTPGLRESLPGFRRLTRPFLRDAESGADTMVWLASDDGRPLRTTGRFWLDRRVRSIHRLPQTRRSDTAHERELLWQWCIEHAGIVPETPSLGTAPGTT